jgi:3-phenylpropionate/trans-cinnamate dioxygenase ferredoxin subunit
VTGEQGAAEPAATSRERPGDKRYIVARAADIPEGTRLIVDVEGRSIGIFNIDGRFHAILNRCPHRGGELCRGDVIGEVVSNGPGDFGLDSARKLLACPWHGWEYDVETGESWYQPDEHEAGGRHPRARSFGVAVEPGDDLAGQLAEGRAVPARPGGAIVDEKTRRVRGPYTAEIFPVDVEDDYIVMSLRHVTQPRDV